MFLQSLQSRGSEAEGGTPAIHHLRKQNVGKRRITYSTSPTIDCSAVISEIIPQNEEGQKSEINVESHVTDDAELSVPCETNQEQKVTDSAQSSYRGAAIAVSSKTSVISIKTEESVSHVYDEPIRDSTKIRTPLIGSRNASKTQLQFELQYQDFDKMLDKNRNYSRLNSTWTDTMYEYFHNIWPTCSLVFQSNRFVKPFSRKGKAAYWTALARCRVTNCITAKFSIQEEPKKNEHIQVYVIVTGICSHLPCLDPRNSLEDQQQEFGLHKRPLRGERRYAIAKVLHESKKSATTEYVERLAEMQGTELEAGNITHCKTPEVFRKAISEYVGRRRLCDDLRYECDIAMSTWKAAIRGQHMHGFIQGTGLDPFYVVSYTERQITAYLQSVKGKRNSVLHFDSTGSVIKKVPNQKQPYYYSLVLEDVSIPAVDFITTRHNATWICGLLEIFLYSVRECNGGKHAQPSVIVTDFSYALIYAALFAFNKMTIISYLRATYNDCISANPQKRKSYTHVCICCAHMMKAVASRLVRIEHSKEKRKACLVIFSRLQRCSTLQVCWKTCINFITFVLS